MSEKRTKVLIGICLSIVLAFILYFLSTHYAYYTAGEIEKYNSVYVATTYTDKQDNVVDTTNTGLYGTFYSEYHIGEVDPNEHTTVFNTFKMSGLEPATTYSVTINFNYESLDTETVEELKVGSINYKPEELYDPETKKAYNNITDVTTFTTPETESQQVDSVANITEVTDEEVQSESVNSFTTFQVVEGMNTYSVEMEFQTNELGEIWFVIAFDSIGESKIDYRLSNIMINYAEV